jgi:alkanesulfonate monooxygenase SsuD/methylene tetrahydromethanopterin reductase-like flavin-dependent oxidoreductase (luciferase family)
MRVCLMIEGQEGVTWDDWVALADACERHGVEALFRSDHYLGIGGRDRPADALDAWATISALAVRTERIRLGTLVSPVTFRHPAVVARMAVTADHISGGRIEVGIGAGWYEAEHDAHGFDFPPVGERFDKLEHDAEAIVQAWTDDPTAQPKPVQQPHPPLIVGGSAKPRGAGLAARLAQEYNTVFATADECRRRRAALDEACRAADRDPATLPLSLMTGVVVGRTRDEVRQRAARLYAITRGQGGLDAWIEQRSRVSPIGTVDEVADRLRELESVGVVRVMLQHLDHRDLETVAVIGEELAPAVG